MSNRRLVRPISLFATLLAGVLFALPASAGKKDYWKGKPNFEAGEVRGFFVWQDDGVWHVRWTSEGTKGRVFSGQIKASGPFTKYSAVKKDDRGDYIKKVSDRQIEFDTKTYQGVDGVDFGLSPSTERVTFDFYLDGKRITTKEVRIGNGREHPPAIPFVIDRKTDAPRAAEGADGVAKMNSPIAAAEAKSGGTTPPADAKTKPDDGSTVKPATPKSSDQAAGASSGSTPPGQETAPKGSKSKGKKKGQAKQGESSTNPPPPPPPAEPAPAPEPAPK